MLSAQHIAVIILASDIFVDCLLLPFYRAEAVAKKAIFQATEEALQPPLPEISASATRATMETSQADNVVATSGRSLASKTPSLASKTSSLASKKSSLASKTSSQRNLRESIKALNNLLLDAPADAISVTDATLRTVTRPQRADLLQNKLLRVVLLCVAARSFTLLLYRPASRKTPQYCVTKSCSEHR
ncbi:uncharacterized protein LOC144134627 [Amblyomma americanum]